MGAVVCGVGHKMTSSHSLAGDNGDDSDDESSSIYVVRVNSSAAAPDVQQTRSGHHRGFLVSSGERRRRVSIAWMDEYSMHQCIFCRAEKVSCCGNVDEIRKDGKSYCSMCQQLADMKGGSSVNGDEECGRPLWTASGRRSRGSGRDRSCYPYLCSVCCDNKETADGYCSAIDRLAANHSSVLVQERNVCSLCQFFSGHHEQWDSLDSDVTNVSEAIKVMSDAMEQHMSQDKNTAILKKRGIRIAVATEDYQQIVIRAGWTSYHIHVANPPDKQPGKEDKTGNVREGACTGTVQVVRKAHPRLFRSTAQEVDSVDSSPMEKFPPMDTFEACEKAAARLRDLAQHLQHGEVPLNVLQKTLHYGACVLEAVCMDETRRRSSPEARSSRSCEPAPQPPPSRPTRSLTAAKKTTPMHPLKQLISSCQWTRRLLDEEDELSEVQPDAVPNEVREWLASTFTRQTNTTRRRSEDKPRFRSVANAIRAGIMVDRIYRRLASATLMHIPSEVAFLLKRADDWSFDAFALNDVANGQVLRYIAYDLLNRYGVIHKFKIPSNILEAFLTQIELGYCKFKNPYHNNLHAADVTQTVHYMLCQAGLANWLTDLEIYATLIAAVIHDYQHTGTTNNFHVMSGSETALLYNDRAVLENFHVSEAFKLMRLDEYNITLNLSKEEYREFRSLVIEMVLGTDMSSHFQQIKAMKSIISHHEFSIDKAKALSLVLHCSDISHPSKEWKLHYRWTHLLMEEFFRQGDKENELGLPYSPLCDRNTTLIAESQIGFIDFIVSPSMEVCGDMLEKIQQQLQGPRPTALHDSISEEIVSDDSKPRTRSLSAMRSLPTQGNATSCSVDSSSSSSSTDCPFRTTTPGAGSSSSAPTSPFCTPKGVRQLKRPWVVCLEENRAKWQEKAAIDAECRAKKAEEAAATTDETPDESNAPTETEEVNASNVDDGEVTSTTLED